jgi:hypothetical protein
MSEKVSIPFRHIGDVGECSLMPIGEELTPLQEASKAVLETIPYFRTLPAAKQEIAFQALSVLGAYAISTCDGKWSSSRGYDIWHKLNLDAIVVVNLGIRAANEITMESGFMKLFKMLECGANTIEGLKEANGAKVHEFAVRSGIPRDGINLRVRKNTVL